MKGEEYKYQTGASGEMAAFSLETEARIRRELTEIHVWKEDERANIEILQQREHLRSEASRDGVLGNVIARKHRVCENTVYRWRRKYDGLGPSELRRLKELECPVPEWC